MTVRPVLAIIPARGGSKGLPGKNTKLLSGLPLIAHSIRFAKICKDIDRYVVSTDSLEIAKVAKEHGAEPPFIRPAELANDDTPMIPVLQHALIQMELRDHQRYESIILLDPTSPGRLPNDVSEALMYLQNDTQCVGVVAVSQPHFPIRWNSVEIANNYLRLTFSESTQYVRRQDVPTIYRINGTLYVWRRDFLLRAPPSPLGCNEPHRALVIPDERAIHIDSPSDLRLAELLIREKILKFPWLDAF